MSTMVVRMACDPGRREEVVDHLRDDVTVWALEQAGFLTGAWHVTADGRWGIGVVEFGSADAAERAAVGPRGYHDPEAAFRIASVEVYKRVAATTAAAPSAAPLP